MWATHSLLRSGYKLYTQDEAHEEIWSLQTKLVVFAYFRNK